MWPPSLGNQEVDASKRDMSRFPVDKISSKANQPPYGLDRGRPKNIHRKPCGRWIVNSPQRTTNAFECPIANFTWVPSGIELNYIISSNIRIRKILIVSTIMCKLGRRNTALHLWFFLRLPKHDTCLEEEAAWLITCMTESLTRPTCPMGQHLSTEKRLNNTRPTRFQCLHTKFTERDDPDNTAQLLFFLKNLLN